MRSRSLDYTPLTERAGLRGRLRTVAGDNLLVIGMTVGVLLTAAPHRASRSRSSPRVVRPASDRWVTDGRARGDRAHRGPDRHRCAGDRAR
ncbi:hypothetical protein [Nocardioides sp.]|uniref:hypothetical protein n=1 Tax=Nocardioides sp. TaxID=35761 RepID=UPI003D6B453D